MKQAFYINGACYGRNLQIWEPVSTTQPWPCILISVLCKMKILYCFYSDKSKSYMRTKNSSNNKGAYKVLSETPTSPLAPKDNLCSAWCVSPQSVFCVSMYVNIYKNEDMLSWWQLLFSPVMLSVVGCGSLQSPEDGKGPPLHGPTHIYLSSRSGISVISNSLLFQIHLQRGSLHIYLFPLCSLLRRLQKITGSQAKHFWTNWNQDLEVISVRPCSLQHYSQ